MRTMTTTSERTIEATTTGYAARLSVECSGDQWVPVALVPRTVDLDDLVTIDGVPCYVVEDTDWSLRVRPGCRRLGYGVCFAARQCVSLDAGDNEIRRRTAPAGLAGISSPGRRSLVTLPAYPEDLPEFVLLTREQFDSTVTRAVRDDG